MSDAWHVLDLPGLQQNFLTVLSPGWQHIGHAAPGLARVCTLRPACQACHAPTELSNHAKVSTAEACLQAEPM